MNYREMLRIEEKEEEEVCRQAKQIARILEGKRALPEKDVIEIQRRKAVKLYEGSRRP